jgi:glutathione S-transferase
MLTLYVKTGCPFCAKVKSAIAELGIEDKIEELNIADEGVADELMEKGGQRMVPFLIDADKEVSMYESDDIVAYLKEHYAGA